MTLRNLLDANIEFENPVLTNEIIWPRENEGGLPKVVHKYLHSNLHHGFENLETHSLEEEVLEKEITNISAESFQDEDGKFGEKGETILVTSIYFRPTFR